MQNPPPVRKISETILDFGQPLLRQLDGDYFDPVAHTVFETIIMVWNAHVMALPQWGRPQFLADLRRLVMDPGIPSSLIEAVRELTQRRLEHFANDGRAVGEWKLVQRGDTTVLRCDARAPNT